MPIVSQRATRPGQLAYGYRITVLKDGYKSIALPTIFAPDVPELWHDLCNDQAVMAATLRRRGKLVDQYRREAVAQ